MAYTMPNSRYVSALKEYFQELTQIVNRSLENDKQVAVSDKFRFLLIAVHFVGKATPLQAWTGP